MSRTKRSELQITGMTCAACASRIERTLKKMDGIVDVNVNFTMENATVTFDQTEVGMLNIEKKINDLGFGIYKEKKGQVPINMNNELFFGSLFFLPFYLFPFYGQCLPTFPLPLLSLFQSYFLTHGFN